MDRARDAFDKLNKENPVVVYATAGAVVLAAGGLVAWRLVRR
ncbi:hypothetical protein GCM10025866_13360 [Naasia aerilata]|uniref:DUF3185 family protein n=1 Tax=Naasia aerilata TaxID=1162966 RepID=A0ABM8GB30_9MICO|nr:hypothetical protein GCM10025866_13360 [Naasia aerilata]